MKQCDCRSAITMTSRYYFMTYFDSDFISVDFNILFEPSNMKKTKKKMWEVFKNFYCPVAV